MNISIDATGLSPNKTGTVTYLVEILGQWNLDRAVGHEFVIFCTPATRHHFDEIGLDGRFHLVMAPSSKLAQMIWQQTALPLFLVHHKIAVHWGPGFVLPLWGGCPMVVTIHDMTFDLFPEVHEPIKRFYFPFMIRRAVKRAVRVLAISQATADDLDHLIPGIASKTVVTHLAARTLGLSPNPFLNDEHSSNLDIAWRSREDPSKSNEAHEPNPSIKYQTEPYALFIGTLEPRKNLERLLQAWKQLPQEIRGEHRLIVVGVKGWMVDQLQAEGNDSIEFVGHVSDQALQSFLSGASCFVYPSLYEGFGLPVIEAMAAGVPVLTSNVGATSEIAKDAALLVDPLSIDEIVSGLRRLLTDSDLRLQLSEAGLKRAGEFSWARTARLTLEALSFSGSKAR
jgi:glycosyltransferase involved in cell wall biosynthesis